VNRYAHGIQEDLRKIWVNSFICRSMHFATYNQ